VFIEFIGLLGFDEFIELLGLLGLLELSGYLSLLGSLSYLSLLGFCSALRNPHSKSPPISLTSNLLISLSFLLFPYFPISPSPCPPIYFFLPSIFRHLPDNALGSKFAVELWIHTLTAMVNVETFTAFLTKSRFVFLTDSNRFPVWMVSALHLIFSYPPSRFIQPRLFLLSQCPTKHFSNQGLRQAMREFNLFRNLIGNESLPAIRPDLFGCDSLARS
jgi:hypothetical protein